LTKPVDLIKTVNLIKTGAGLIPGLRFVYGPSVCVMTELREITADNLRAVLGLSVTDAQDEYVAPNVWSVAEAAYNDEKWLRAIYADDEPVGLVLLSERRNQPRYYLWRFMVDQAHQGHRHGKRAVELLIQYVRTLPNATELFLSFVPGPEGPEGFYRFIGFEPTGRIEGDEHEMVLAL
jgi:diamine N-acetyltransferase